LQLGEHDQQVAPQQLILGRARDGAQLLRQLAGLARGVGEAQQRVAVLRVGRIDVEQGHADAIGARRIVGGPP
jgi:hypothetical protein